MSNDYNVASWNVGVPSDYVMILDRAERNNPGAMKEILGVPDGTVLMDESGKPTQALVDAASKKKHSLLQHAIRRLKSSESPDIICFQEVEGKARAIMGELGKGYAITTDREGGELRPDVAVAFNKKKFKLISVTRNPDEHFVVVDLVDKKTKEVVRVISAHVTGCDPKVSDDSDEWGNNELRHALAKASKNETTACIIGMDANVTPEHGRRLKIIEDAQFKRDASDKNSSAYNPILNENIKIDYIYVKGKDGLEVRIETHNVNGFNLEDPSLNPSDHIPLAGKISLTKPGEEVGAGPSLKQSKTPFAKTAVRIGLGAALGLAAVGVFLNPVLLVTGIIGTAIFGAITLFRRFRSKQTVDQETTKSVEVQQISTLTPNQVSTKRFVKDLKKMGIVDLDEEAIAGGKLNLSGTLKELSPKRKNRVLEKVSKLTFLTELDLSKNGIETVPESMENLTQITKLSLSQNPLKSEGAFSPPLALKILYKGGAIKELDLSETGLTNFTLYPELRNLKMIDISRNPNCGITKHCSQYRSLVSIVADFSNQDYITNRGKVRSIIQWVWTH